MPQQQCELERPVHRYTYSPKPTFRQSDEEGMLLIAMFILVIGALAGILAAQLHFTTF